MNFNARKYFPVLVKPFQFEALGIKNKQDCKLLCKTTKMLLEKYPKRNIKSRKKSSTGKNHHNCRLEGSVEDTY